jgi:hypothetical protein
MAERESGQPESVEGSGPFERADGATSFLQRAVIRRRVRFLRRRRELALHDLGGFLFESHRLGQPREDLLADKLAALTALDDELALLQQSLSLREELAVLREPGIAACAHCATIRDSAANFCPNCGRPAASPAEDEPEIASVSIEAPAAISEDTAIQPPDAVTQVTTLPSPPAPSENTAVSPPDAVTQVTTLPSPPAPSEDTAVSPLPAAVDAPATADGAAHAAPPGGEPSPAAVEGTS